EGAAPSPLAEGSAHGVDDDGVRHQNLLQRRPSIDIGSSPWRPSPSSSCGAWTDWPPLLDGDTKRLASRRRAPTHGAVPHRLERWPRAAARSPGLVSPSDVSFTGFDAPVGRQNTLDHTIPLQEVEAPRQRRLVDGAHALELPQVRLT